MQAPVLMNTNVQNETFAGLTYHLQGELVPALTVELPSDNSVYFEHHVLLWKHPSVSISIRAMRGALKRMIAGMQIFVTQAQGPGLISFSRDGAGHIVPIHLRHGEEIHVREHQFLAASANIDYTFERVRGIANLLFGGSGFFIDRFHAGQGDGIVWLHGYGNVFEKTLAAGEAIDVEPSGWLYKDPGVRMETSVQNISTGLFSGMSLTMNRFIGPGRVGIQSMTLLLPSPQSSNNQ